MKRWVEMKRKNVSVANDNVSIFWKSSPGPVYDLNKIFLGWHGRKRIVAEVAKDSMGNIEFVTIRT